ncbi:glutamyl-tRNA synthetase class Ic [Parvibaculum lavamentivorans DS-1]|uniref:Glutamyl-tRNA synthetase class Ic n=1 Tax=Parvibaculum lavamentivorans (strain DS-1 / DSM 13023 / NCIMB 13966) TaxID=402881 RepID=A7HTL7_PARL1|nr:tRNA glutamyl-Q(34) synthetase GluQRS [Parvibaculum lavamentivorans]ABS63250.1 glutamyl-tRNA synthetase class Ic [Parvibaculum lavamentivorans DS-1]
MQEKTSGQETLRFAPSPNGWLHLGHAYSALFAWEMAAALHGRFLLRIEDIDTGRCRPEFEAAIYEDLAWLGIDWEQPVRRQSEHFADYEQALKNLRDMEVVYPCFATRKEIQDAIIASGVPLQNWPRDPDGALLYPGIYKDIPRAKLNKLMWEGRTYAWRLDIAKALQLAEARTGALITFREEGESAGGEPKRLPVKPELFGDVVIARKDVPTSYHLAVTVDDALQGVTLVTRGQDLFPATYIHRILQVLLDLPEPRYHHHGLIRDEEGRRLSKSAKDMGLRELRAAGHSPADIRRMVGL